ncbi:MAG: hypothetical protein NTX49_04790 [Chlamydiae bacterium]|nr:hypothetical protein [Chlamydiota bacterium]
MQNIPQAAKSIDKVKRIITAKTLSTALAVEPAKNSSTYRPVKLPGLSLKHVSRREVSTKKSRLLPSKTHLLGSLGDTLLAKKALDTSDFCSGEQRLQAILISLRQRDFAQFLPGRCAPWHFKELALAKNKLKNMKKSPNLFNSHSFTNLSWEEISRQKEERQGIQPRVVKQLSK